MLDGEVWDDAQDREVWRAEKGGVLGSDDSPARYDRVCALLLLSKLRGLRVLHVDSLDPVTPLNHPDAAVLLLVLPLLESFTWRAGIYGGCELNSLVPIFRAAPNLRSFTGWKCERSTPATAVLGMESITTLTLEFSAVGGDWFEQVLERTSSLKHLCYYEAQEVSQVVGTANVARFSAGLRKVRGSLKTLKIDITHFCLGEQHPPLGPFHDFPRLKVLLIGYHWLVRPGEHRMGLADVLPQGLVYLSMSVCEGPASEECYEDLFVLLSQKEKGRFVKLKCVKIWTDDCNLASRVAVSCESVGMKFWINDQLVRAVGTGSVSSISQ